jgi:Subtilase family
VYLSGRQLPWAELLDDLARRLDIVIVVSAGNVPDADIPTALNSPQFQREVINSLKTEKHRLIDPATAALCITVGAIARRDDPSMLSLGTPLAAAPRGCPSPFTRCGPGVAGAVKPEVVAPGGNFAVDSIAGTAIWRRQDPNLGEPTLNWHFPSGRLLRATCGTSFAAAQVTHIAARMEAALRNQFGVAPSQNLVRALLINSARIDGNIKEWLGEQQDDLLRTVGYGQPNVEFCWSVPNRVTLVTEEVVSYKSFHVYSLIVPENFLQEKGKRSITVSLAYDPPTRLSRRDYIATAMWLEIFGGLTTEQVFEYRTKYEGDGEPPTAPDKNKLDFKPGGQTLRMSTVQSRAWHSNQGTKFLNRQLPDGDATLHIFVGCQPRFQNPLGEDRQRYALVITLEHENQQIDVYQEVRARIRTRARIRI